MKRVTIEDILTEDEIKRAVELWADSPTGFHKRVLVELIEPNRARINASLGQENDARYLAYLIEYVIGHSKR